MTRPRSVRTARPAAAVLCGAVLATAGCTSGGDAPAAASSTAASSAAAGSTTPAATGAAGVGGEFGPACAGVPADGPGSFAGMAGAPLGTAVAANPLLTTLAGAVRNANLLDALNSASDVTVLAPVDAAFVAVPRATLDPLLADSARLTQTLTHHVLQGRLTPEELPGQHTTLAGDTVTVTGSGQQLGVPADGTLAGGTAAAVVCGDVQTANATVYLVDQVLAPAG